MKGQNQLNLQQSFTYQIKVQDRIDKNEFNAMSPTRMMIERLDSEETLFTVYTDQSGLIGIIRYLHSRGFVLLSIIRK